MSANHVRIVEVGPRDGLQNEPQIWSVADRIKLIDDLSQCGFAEIEVGSFVSAKRIPQMADTDIVFQQIKQNPDVRYSTLVPNNQGLNEALACGVRNISLFTAATDTFNLKNINCTIAGSFERFEPVMNQAKDLGLRVRGYVSCVIECPYEGIVTPLQVLKVVKRLVDIGCDEISLGDTIGSGSPETIGNLLKILSHEVPLEKLAIHCHDTYGNAISNIFTALELGIRTVDSAIFGLGGCPYAGEKAKGNVATELVVAKLRDSAYYTDIDGDKLTQIVANPWCANLRA